MATALDLAGFEIFVSALRAHRKITFVLTDAANLMGHYALTDVERAVTWLDEDADLGELRATIIHELHHLLCPDCDENEIEAMTARALVPLSAALHAHAHDLVEETAQRLAVDTKLVRARIRDAGLTTGHHSASAHIEAAG